MIIFGNQWAESVGCFKILAISIFFQITSSSAGSIYLSLGNTKLMFKSGMISTVLMVFGIVTGVLSGEINRVALYVTIALIIRFIIDYYFLIKICFGYSASNFYRIFIPDICILIALLMIMKGSNIIAIDNLLLSALYKFSVCSSAYIILLFLTKQYKYFIVLLPLKIQQKFHDHRKQAE